MYLLRSKFQKIFFFMASSLTLLIITCRPGEAQSATVIAKDFVKAGLNGDFKKLATLCCKDNGPYTTLGDIQYLDLGDLGYVDKILREEESEVDPYNLKLVVARASVLGEIGFYCFYIFKTPDGYKIYLKNDFLWKYPPSKVSLTKIALQFYLSNKLNLKTATKLAEHLVQLYEDDLESIYKLGQVYFLLGRKEDALAQYEKLIIKNRQYAEKNLSEEDFLLACKGLLESDIEQIKLTNKNLLYFIAEKLFLKDHYQKAIPVMIEMWIGILDSIKDKNKRSIIYGLEQYKALLNKYGRYGDEAQIEMYKKAVQMLTKYMGVDAAPILIKALKSCNWDNFQCCYEEVGAEIIYNLGELKDTRAIQILIWAIPETVKPMSSAAAKWGPNLAKALIKLDAKDSILELKKIMNKFLIDERYTLEEIAPYLNPLTEFTGSPWIEINWEKVKKTLKHLTSLNWSARGILGGFDEENYLKASAELEEITNPENFEIIKNWVFPLEKKKRPSTLGSQYKLTQWLYGNVSFCDVENDKIYIKVNRYPYGRTRGEVIDESLLILRAEDGNIEIYDIQKPKLDLSNSIWRKDLRELGFYFVTNGKATHLNFKNYEKMSLSPSAFSDILVVNEGDFLVLLGDMPRGYLNYPIEVLFFNKSYDGFYRYTGNRSSLGDFFSLELLPEHSSEKVLKMTPKKIVNARIYALVLYKSDDNVLIFFRLVSKG